MALLRQTAFLQMDTSSSLLSTFKHTSCPAVLTLGKGLQFVQPSSSVALTHSPVLCTSHLKVNVQSTLRVLEWLALLLPPCSGPTMACLDYGDLLLPFPPLPPLTPDHPL